MSTEISVHIHILILSYRIFQESGKKLGDKFENFGDKLKKVGTYILYSCSVTVYLLYNYIFKHSTNTVWPEIFAP